jgi:hypothetical protein
MYFLPAQWPADLVVQVAVQCRLVNLEPANPRGQISNPAGCTQPATSAPLIFDLFYGILLLSEKKAGKGLIGTPFKIRILYQVVLRSK